MNYATIHELTRKVRASLVYDDWVKRNKGIACFLCNSTENIECHHVTWLYHTILGTWKIFGDVEATFQYVLSLHENDHCDSITLCNPCHSNTHESRKHYSAVSSANIVVDFWSVIPRNFPLPFTHSTKLHKPGTLGLIDFQTLLGIGWYIINSHMESRIIEFNQRRFAELIGKTPSTSFFQSLHTSLSHLQSLSVILAYHIQGNNVEIHMNPAYLDQFANPWFLPLKEVKSKSMCILTLKWFLSMQSNKSTYSISLDKLKKHLGIISSDFVASRSITKACRKIKWASVKIVDGICRFEFERNKAVPIHELRRVLNDAIEQGR